MNRIFSGIPYFEMMPWSANVLRCVLDGRVTDAIRIGSALDHERERTLTPSVVLDADHGYLGNAGALRDQVLDL